MNPRKIAFMLNKLYHDLKSTGDVYKISEDLHSEKLGEYYFLFEEDPAKLNRLITGFDENGIPINSPYIDVDKAETHYYPISIGQYGLALFNTFIRTGSENKREHFLRIADWFYKNRIEDNKLGTYWLTDIPKPEYKISAPWRSAFTQSRGISTLLRAWQLTNDKNYFESAKSALTPYSFNLIEGGVAAFTEHGKFYEEYVATEPTMVLDGHIFSLLGLYDYYRAVSENTDTASNKLAKELFDEGINSLIKWLPEYDMGYWLRFNMCKMSHYPDIDPCTIGYLKLVLLQMDLLFKITGRIELNEFRIKFGMYDKIFNKLRMYPLKYKALKILNRV